MADGSDRELSGGCLCGGARFTAVLPADAAVVLCHCKMCRRSGGGLPLAVAHARVTLRAGGDLRWWRGSPWGERGFCGVCGSSLFFRMAGDESGAWSVSAGALDDDGVFARIKEHIFIDDKADFYEFADDGRRLSGAEFTAELMPKIIKRAGLPSAAPVLAMCRQHHGDIFTGEVERLLAAKADGE